MQNQKGYSTTLLVLLISVVVLLAATTIFYAARFSFSQKEKAQVQNQLQTAQNQQQEEAQKEENKPNPWENKDALLQKLFPKLSFEDGVATNLSEDNLKLSLKDSFEDNFISSNEKSLLLVAKLDGVGHAGGLYHAFLGIFDKEGNLLTPVSMFAGYTATSKDYDLYADKAQFGGDNGSFAFYDCQGIKYILFLQSGCPNSSCCSDGAKVFKVNSGLYTLVQSVDSKTLSASKYSLKINISDDKLIVNRVPGSSDYGCKETPYKTVTWDKDTCKFK